MSEYNYQMLQSCLRSYGSVAVAFSGGVDSTFLLQAAVDILGKDHVLALTAFVDAMPQREKDEAEAFCQKRGIRQIPCAVDVFTIQGFAENPPDRCYHCKRALFQTFLEVAHRHGITTVVEGSNLDDEGDYRPGMRAIAELKIESPLRKAGLTKQQIRTLSKEMGLPTWDKPSFACLASRFAYGEPITKERLAMVETAEQILFSMGFAQFRVRVHGQGSGTVARIELPPEEFGRLMADENRRLVYEQLQQLGFSYVTLDLKGYRMGSMNEMIEKK